MTAAACPSCGILFTPGRRPHAHLGGTCMVCAAAGREAPTLPGHLPVDVSLNGPGDKVLGVFPMLMSQEARHRAWLLAATVVRGLRPTPTDPGSG